jgi:uncharacterized protein
MLKNYPSAETEPLVLIIPGLNNSGPGHWQTLWERELPHAVRVDLGNWADPHRNNWVNRLNLAIHKAGRPVILVAHSLACNVVAWWAEYERPAADGAVLGALLVAPPDVEREEIDPRVARFAPVMKTPLPFPSILAASRDDPWIGFDRARRLARIWKSRFVDAGWLGHINADSGIRDWPFGQYLLRQLRAAAEPLNQPLLRGRNYETLLLEQPGRPAAVW